MVSENEKWVLAYVTYSNYCPMYLVVFYLAAQWMKSVMYLHIKGVHLCSSFKPLVLLLYLDWHFNETNQEGTQPNLLVF